jgi:hypothetical protein
VCLDREVILFVDSEFSGGRHILQFETCLSGSLTSSHTSVIKKSHIQSSSETRRERESCPSLEGRGVSPPTRKSPYLLFGNLVHISPVYVRVAPSAFYSARIVTAYVILYECRLLICAAYANNS